MFRKVFGLVFLYFMAFTFNVNAQQPINLNRADTSVTFTATLDSTQVLSIGIDSITPPLLRIPDSLTRAKIADSLSKGTGYPIFNLTELINGYRPKDLGPSSYQPGALLPKGDIWVLAIVAFLIVLFAVLKNSFSKQLTAIVQSFFSNRALVNLNKEDNLFTSWPFLLLFVQFGFTIGMFFYLVAQYQQLEEVTKGFQFYLTISVLIIALYTLKIILLRLMGYIFNVQKPVNEYISILYLSYFNASLLFMPLVIAFALSPLKYGTFYIAIAAILLAIIFVFQFIRAGINILSHYRFSKVYLFLYFCTLEICPILILIKAIGF